MPGRGERDGGPSELDLEGSRRPWAVLRPPLRESTLGWVCCWQRRF